MSLLSYIFQAPKPATYTIESFPGELCWFPNQDGKNLIPCLWAPFAGSETVLIYLHGNASDLGTDHDFVWRLNEQLQVNVLAVEFDGYGPVQSCQLPTETNLFRRVQEVCATLSSMPAVKRILILGYSLGASAAIHLAAHSSCPKLVALILYAPFSSIHNLIDDRGAAASFLTTFIPNHVFHNQATIQTIQMPIAIFHGTADTLIPMHHSQDLATANPVHSRLFMLPDVTHNISATTRGETRLLQMTRTFLDEVMGPDTVITTQTPILFPVSFWTAPTMSLQTTSGWISSCNTWIPSGNTWIPSGNTWIPCNAGWLYGVGALTFLFGVLFLMRHCIRLRPQSDR